MHKDYIQSAYSGEKENEEGIMMEENGHGGPGGRRRQHTGADAACQCGSGMHRFTEICLLVLLCEQAGYGYALAEQMELCAMPGEELNAGTLYRALRRMEKDGWVVSSWESSEQGPDRRVYTITPAGRDALDERVRMLELRKARIERLLERYAAHNRGTAEKTAVRKEGENV